MLSAELLEDEPHKVFDQVDIIVRCVAAYCRAPVLQCSEATLWRLCSKPHLTGRCTFHWLRNMAHDCACQA